MTALPDAVPQPVPMVEVDCDLHSVAHRFGLVTAAGGAKVGQKASAPIAPGADLHSEFRDPAGGTVALKVTAGGRTTCWLREDLIHPARCKQLAERREYNDVTEATLKWAMANPAPNPDCKPAPLSQALVRAAFRNDKRMGRLHGTGEDASRRRAFYANALRPDRLAKGGQS